MIWADTWEPKTRTISSLQNSFLDLFVCVCIHMSVYVYECVCVCRNVYSYITAHTRWSEDYFQESDLSSYGRFW